MAQTGYTPILIYGSSTGGNAPAAGNLTNSTLGSELAINITDGKLFYKDNANVVQVIGWKTTPTTAGGTGLTSYTAGDLLYYASGTTLTKLAIGASGRWLGSSGTAPQWNAPAALTKTDDTNVTLTLGGSASTALLNAASLTLGWTGTLAVSRGGTGTGTAGIAAFNNITGYTASGATGSTSTNLVFSTSPSITTPTLVGDSTMSTGNLIQGTAAKGVNFTANTAAAGKTSQLLNYYEEGTFSPTVEGTTTVGTVTYNSRFGRYTRIGRMVFFEIYLYWQSGTGTGFLVFGGLPFTSANSNTYPAISVGGFYSLTFNASTFLQAYVDNNSTKIILSNCPTGGTNVSPGQVAYDDSASIQLAGCYTV
jgi:hypothetical protein